MIGRGAWLRLWYAWVPAALVVAADVVWLAAMRGAVLGRGPLVDRQVGEAKAAVSRLQSQADQLERIKKSVTALEANLGALHHMEMAPMRDRLVAFLTDVVKRTELAGLRPERVSYTAKREEKSGLVYFTASYRVKGSYEQIRQCAYLLESSPQFIVLEGLSLRGDEMASSLEVAVQLGVGTYFSDLDEGLVKQLGINEVASGT